MRHAVTLSVRASTLSLRAVLPAKTRPGRRAVTIAAGSPRTGSQQVCHNRLEGFRQGRSPPLDGPVASATLVPSRETTRRGRQAPTGARRTPCRRVLGRTATSSSSRPALTGVQSPRSRRGSHLKATPLEPGCSLHAGFGLSDETDSKAAVEQAISRAGVREPVMAFVSCTADRDPAVVLQHFKVRVLMSRSLHAWTSGPPASLPNYPIAAANCSWVHGCHVCTGRAAWGLRPREYILRRRPQHSGCQGPGRGVPPSGRPTRILCGRWGRHQRPRGCQRGSSIGG